MEQNINKIKIFFDNYLKINIFKTWLLTWFTYSNNSYTYQKWVDQRSFYVRSVILLDKNCEMTKKKS